MLGAMFHGLAVKFIQFVIYKYKIERIEIHDKYFENDKMTKIRRMTCNIR